MTRIERRRYEMLLRVRDFAETHGEMFSGLAAAQEAFDSVIAAVNELTAAHVQKLSASVSARANRKARARKALVEVLTRASQLARMLRACGGTLPAFELPLSRTDPGLLTVARQFAQDTVGFEAEFTSHGMDPAVITEVADAFYAAVLDRDRKRADYRAARTRIHYLLKSALLEVRRIDVIVSNHRSIDNTIRVVWTRARRVDGPRRSRRGGKAEAAAEVLPMPSREVA
jgi:hypothetical protein